MSSAHLSINKTNYIAYRETKEIVRLKEEIQVKITALEANTVFKAKVDRYKMLYDMQAVDSISIRFYSLSIYYCIIQR